MPWRSASTNTASKGRNRNSTRKTSAASVSSHCVSGVSLSAGCLIAGWVRTAWAISTMTRARPMLEQVDGEQQEERGQQHHHGQDRGARIVELLELAHDQERDDLRDRRHVAGDED